MYIYITPCHPQDYLDSLEGAPRSGLMVADEIIYIYI